MVEKRAPQLHPVAPSPQDVILIWTAIADQPYPGLPFLPKDGDAHAATKRKPVVLLDRSTQTCSGARAQQVCASSLDQELLSSSAVDAFVSKQAREALILANASQVTVRLPDSDYVRGAPTATVDALLMDVNWAAFYKAFPGTAGYLQLSVPVLIDGGSHALVYAEQRCDGLCGTGTLYLLSRAGNGWEIANGLVLWVS
ncbi:hypothetical protein [Xanthomonas arboricola]|uniref:hypothetical protein n=1 Tax=Xanthomonas arboricola TaxID=56448 RepID=UPI0012900E62|nr:hypothetical protein [Xanthomonas arboricola]